MRNFYYFIFGLVFGLKTVKVAGQTTSPADYFRSAKTGAWDAPGTWESSTDGITWTPSSLSPTLEANTITVLNSHTVTITNSTTVDQLVVTKGGVLNLATSSASALTISNGAASDIIVQSGGVFRHNITGTTLPVFNPSAILEIQSGGILEVANNNGLPSNYAIANSPVSSNIAWADGAVFNWNNTASPLSGVTYFPSLPVIPVLRLSKTTTIGGTDTTVINGLLEAVVDSKFSSAGVKIFRNGITGAGKVAVTSINGGKFIINGTTATLGGSGSIELSSKGLLITKGTVATLTSNKTVNNYSTSISTVTNEGTLMAGDYVISGSSKVQIDGTVKTTNINGLSGGTNTTFTTTAGFTVNATGSYSIIEYSRLGDQTVTPLAYKNLLIAGTGAKTAGLGADVSVSDTLNIMPGNTFSLNGTNHLKLNSGGVLNINTAAVFDSGGESQVGGGGTPTINIYGTFITRDAQGFSGTNTAVPGGKINIYPGSVIEYGKVGDQDVTSRDDYRNITLSGSGVKTLSTCSPNGTVTIKDNVIADASNKTFGDINTNLTMLGGRFKVGGTETKPDIGGIYDLTGGVIEFTNSGDTKQTIRTPLTYLNIQISGTNVGNSKGIMTIADGGSFTVKAGGNFENTGYRIDGTAGNQTFRLEAGGTFKIGVRGGFSGNDSAALKNIETLIIDPKSTIAYSQKGAQTITPLLAYPTLLLKGSGSKTVAEGTLLLSPAADSLVIDTLVVLKIGAGAKADLQDRPVFIKSSAAGSGMIGEIADGPSALLNATNVTVERFIPGKRSFRFLSSPVTTTTSINDNWMEGAVNTSTTTKINPRPGYGTNITGKGGAVNGFDPTVTNNPSLFTYNSVSEKWEPVTNTNGTLSAGKAYSLLVRGDRSIDMTTNAPTPTNTTLRVKGTVFTGTFSAPISATEGHYSFIGNPYSSAVNWNTLTKQDISNTYYTWDPTLNIRGAYATYNGFNNATAPTGTKIDENIQPGQAFFVRAERTNAQTTGAISPKLTFKEVNKTSINKAVFRPVSVTAKLSIQLLLNTQAGSQNIADAAVVFFDDKFGHSISNEDSYKFTNTDENMAIDRNGKALCIEGRPAITTTDTIALKMWQLTQKRYYLKLSGLNFPSSVTAFLKDTYLRKETPLNLSSATLMPFIIDTAISASYASDRFLIVFKAGSALPVTLTNLSAYPTSEGIQVEWKTNTEINIDRYEVEKSTDGQHFIFEATVTANNSGVNVQKYRWLDGTANQGNNFYRIKIIDKSGAIKYSGIVNVKVKNRNPTITIFPNPITNNIINLYFSNMEAGKYAISLYDNLARSILKTAIVHQNVSSHYSIISKKSMKKGAYRLIISKKDQRITKSLIFQ